MIFTEKCQLFKHQQERLNILDALKALTKIDGKMIYKFRKSMDYGLIKQGLEGL